MSCTTDVCGTGGWNGPKPGDPDNNSILSAQSAFGGIDVSWTYPVTNPFAVAHTILYRATDSLFEHTVQRSIVSGNTYFDKSDPLQKTAQQYWYWIQFVSINGTYGEVIGPATATARPTISQTIEMLTGQIDAGFLAQTLKSKIDGITVVAGDLVTEIKDRMLSDSSFTNALTAAQKAGDDAIAFAVKESETRISGQNALTNKIDGLILANANTDAAILEEKNIRVSKMDAMASDNKLLYVASIDYAAAVKETARVYGNDMKVIAEKFTTVDVTLNGSTATGQIGLTAMLGDVIDESSGTKKAIGTMYTAKLNTEGLIGGFGLYNDGKTVEAGFDVDTFWVGRTNANKKKPFIINTAGETFINDAVIEKLTFEKLRNADGSFVVENGKVKADYLNVTRLMGGAYTAYSWPVNYLPGFYLGPEGLLMGNYYTGKYVQLSSDGSFYAPGLTITNGAARFTGSISTGNNFSVDAAGYLIADNVTIKRRKVVETGTFGVPTFAGYTTVNAGRDSTLLFMSGTNTIYETVIVVPTTMDPYLLNTDWRQPYVAEAFPIGNGTVWSGSPVATWRATCSVSSGRTYSAGGLNTTNDSKLFIKITIFIDIISGTFSQYAPPNFQWVLYKV